MSSQHWHRVVCPVYKQRPAERPQCMQVMAFYVAQRQNQPITSSNKTHSDIVFICDLSSQQQQRQPPTFSTAEIMAPETRRVDKQKSNYLTILGNIP